jgi:signal transduction histidine kinase
VLTDIKMPVMDGIELLKKIKGTAPDTEVIMITGHGDLDLTIKSLQLEAADFITKPIRDEALEVALKRAHQKIALRAKLRDYTENLEKLVETKTRQLLEAERMATMGQTVAGLAHAIKNIVGGLTGGMFVLEKGISLENRKYLVEGWQMVGRNVEKIKNLCLDLLNYAKQRTPEYRLTAPIEPLREVFPLVQSRGQEHGVAVSLESASNLPPTWLDREAIHCALLNLATNAIDACIDPQCFRKDRAVILRALPQPGWAVEYQVEDNGCGMDQETRDRVFQCFFSTKGTRGTGLGLMITKKLIDEHGGEIECSSERDRGTIIKVRLPRREAAEFEPGSQ